MTKLTQNFWETAYMQNIGKMLGICYRYVRDRQIAEDLAHDAFLNAIDKSASFKGEGHFDAWLRKITVNRALQYLREQKKKEYYSEWIQYENEMMVLNEDASTMDFTEEELLDAINQLPEHHKMVFNLFVIDQFSHAEIANELGINESTSKSHLARARKKIRKVLLEKEDKRRTVFSFLLPMDLWNIDKKYRKTFFNFEIEPGNLLKITAPEPSYFLVPKHGSSPVVSSNFINLSVIIGSLAVSLFMVIIFWKQEINVKADKNVVSNTKTDELLTGIETKSDNIDKASIFKNENVNRLQNNDSVSATIFDDAIMYSENNINNTDMKKLNTVGAILLAGATMSFDSSKNLEFKPTSHLKLPAVQFQASKKDFVSDEKEGDGTFYASQIFWSGDSHYVYMKGDKIKVNFGKDKFNAAGSAAFLGEVFYLIVDGKEAKLNETIRLSEGPYHLSKLNARRATQKYGEKGKDGAVEISKL